MNIKVLFQQLASRARRAEITTIVLHATAGGSLSGALSALRNRELSYNYIIDKAGVITKCVPYGREAFHAGKSFGPDGPNVNRYSVGISFVNLNNGIDPYTQAQIDACNSLIAELKSAIPTLLFLTTHAAISPGRKTDPKRFPCSAVANGLKLWGCK